ncbi:MAG TPA: carbohydrate kinase [Candidatus Acidoferrum sp.]
MNTPSIPPFPVVVGLGELLWDLFPAGKQLGGAPANFAYITAMLGDRGIVASRVGDDRLGQEALWQLKSSGLDVSRVQRDPVHPTGTVKVTVDIKGQPEYEITENVAWDFMEFSEDWISLARSTSAVCFGSLAQRNPVSRATIRAFLTALPTFAIPIFDVNLRQSYFSSVIVRDSARHAKVIKLNHEEFPRFLELLQCPLKNTERTDVAAARWLCREFSLRLVCITRGANGSLLVTESSNNEHPGFSVKIADTVGAGDAFTAALVHHALRGSSLAVMNTAANRMGAWVASQEGAMPAADPAILAEVRSPATL